MIGQQNFDFLKIFCLIVTTSCLLCSSASRDPSVHQHSMTPLLQSHNQYFVELYFKKQLSFRSLEFSYTIFLLPENYLFSEPKTICFQNRKLFVFRTENYLFSEPKTICFQNRKLFVFRTKNRDEIASKERKLPVFFGFSLSGFFYEFRSSV